MNFRKKSKWMLTPSPCRKICCELFVNIRSSANSWRNFYGWEMTSSPPPEYSGNSSSFWEQRLSWGHPFKCWTIRWQLVGRWEPQQNSADRIHNSGEVIQKGDKCQTFWFAEFLDHSACFREIALSPSACSIHYSAIMAEAAANTTVQEDTVTNLCWYSNEIISCQNLFSPSWSLCSSADMAASSLAHSPMWRSCRSAARLPASPSPSYSSPHPGLHRVSTELPKGRNWCAHDGETPDWKLVLSIFWQTTRLFVVSNWVLTFLEKIYISGTLLRGDLLWKDLQLST